MLLVDCSEGISTVEFALIAPVLILIVLASIQFGFIFFTYSAAQQAGWSVARQVAIGNMAATSASSNARGMLPTWAQSSASIPAVVLTNGNYTLSITIPLANASPVNFLQNVFNGKSISTSATFLSELN